MAINPFQKIKKDLANKKILIIGLGLLGRGVADTKFLVKLGAKVTVTDLKSENVLKPSLKKLVNLPVKYILGKHRKEEIIKADLILRNAGVPENSPYLKIASSHRIPVLMDETLLLKYVLPDIKVIGITGTRGKSTTTTLIYEILKKAGKRVHLAGNLENIASLPLIEKIKPNDFLVMELSSWQLQGFKAIKFSPQISVITSIFEDHLNRYPNMKSYLNDKKIIYQFQKDDDFLILNRNQAIMQEFANEATSKVYWFGKDDWPKDWPLKIQGIHNQSNAAAALKVGQILKVNLGVIKKAINQFPGLPFRMEIIRTLNLITFINDTTSTTPAAGISALKTFEKPIILIAGGSSKNLSMDKFAKEICLRVKKVIFLKGEETNNLIKLIKKFNGTDKIVGTFSEMEVAVLAAFRLAKAGEIVLLSPGCASFGLFQNEFDRGLRFNQAVAALRVKR